MPCNGCISCCRAALRIKLTPAKAERMPHVVIEGTPFLEQRGRDCALFDVGNDRCSIYETCPRACRE